MSPFLDRYPAGSSRPHPHVPADESLWEAHMFVLRFILTRGLDTRFGVSSFVFPDFPFVFCMKSNFRFKVSYSVLLHLHPVWEKTDGNFSRTAPAKQKSRSFFLNYVLFRYDTK